MCIGNEGSGRERGTKRRSLRVIRALGLVILQAPTRAQNMGAIEAGTQLILWLLVLWVIIIVVRRSRRKQ